MSQDSLSASLTVLTQNESHSVTPLCSSKVNIFHSGVTLLIVFNNPLTFSETSENTNKQIEQYKTRRTIQNLDLFGINVVRKC